MPSTLKRAIRVPGSGSYPAWMMPLLARVVPVPTSLLRSRSATRAVVLLSSKAAAHPTMPAPMIATSKAVDWFGIDSIPPVSARKTKKEPYSKHTRGFPRSCLCTTQSLRHVFC